MDIKLKLKIEIYKEKFESNQLEAKFDFSDDFPATLFTVALTEGEDARPISVND